MSINLEPEDLPIIFSDDEIEEVMRQIEEERHLIEAADAALLEAQYGEIVPAVLSEDFMEKFTKFTEATPEVTKEFQKAIAPFLTIPEVKIEISEKDSKGFWDAL